MADNDDYMVAKTTDDEISELMWDRLQEGINTNRRFRLKGIAGGNNMRYSSTKVVWDSDIYIYFTRESDGAWVYNKINANPTTGITCGDNDLLYVTLNDTTATVLTVSSADYTSMPTDDTGRILILGSVRSSRWYGISTTDISHDSILSVSINDHHARDHNNTEHTTNYETANANIQSHVGSPPTDSHHTRYADSEVETVITAEIVGGQSIDNAIDALILTHKNIATAHHTATVAVDLNHNDLSNINAGTTYEHISAAQVTALHAKYALTEDLSSEEITQLQTIGESTTISVGQWGVVGGLVAVGSGTIISAAERTALHAIYTHPTGSGNKHVPAAGSSGQYLKWASAGTASWDTVTAGEVGAEPSGAVSTHAALTATHGVGQVADNADLHSQSHTHDSHTGTLTYLEGGTGQSTYVKGDLLWASAANVLSRLAVSGASQGDVLTIGASSVLGWEPSGTPGAHDIDGASHTLSGSTQYFILAANSDTTFSFQAFTTNHHGTLSDNQHIDWTSTSSNLSTSGTFALGASIQDLNMAGFDIVNPLEIRYDGTSRAFLSLLRSNASNVNTSPYLWLGKNATDVFYLTTTFNAAGALTDTVFGTASTGGASGAGFGDIVFKPDNVEKMRLSAAGNLRIGMAGSPNSVLDLWRDAAGDIMRFTADYVTDSIFNIYIDSDTLGVKRDSTFIQTITGAGDMWIKGDLTINDTMGLSASGNRWDALVFVASDGVTEVGKYIDFHESDGDTGDYAYRMTSTSSVLYTTGSLVLAGSLTLGANSDVGNYNFQARNFNADTAGSSFAGLTVTADLTCADIILGTSTIHGLDGNYHFLKVGGHTNRWGIKIDGTSNYIYLMGYSRVMFTVYDSTVGYFDSTSFHANTIRSMSDTDHRILMDPAADTIRFYAGDVSSDDYFYMHSPDNTVGNSIYPMFMTENHHTGSLGTSVNAWYRIYCNRILSENGAIGNYDVGIKGFPDDLTALESIQQHSTNILRDGTPALDVTTIPDIFKNEDAGSYIDATQMAAFSWGCIKQLHQKVKDQEILISLLNDRITTLEAGS